MSALLIQNNQGLLVVSLETAAGVPATDLAVTAVQVDLKKTGETFFTNKVLTAPTLATASIGSGTDGTVNLSVLGGAVGNTYTVEVVVPGGTAALDVSKSGTSLTVNLAATAGVPDAAANTATLIAAAINALAGEITATASGTGADPLSTAEGPTTFSGGIDGDFTELGGGSYELTLAEADTDVLGSLFVRVSGATIRTVIETATVATTVSASPTPTFVVPTTAIFGYVLSATGAALVDATVSVRVLSTPTVIHPDSDGALIANTLTTVRTDATGFFSLSLVTGSQIDVTIPAANYRRTFTVPSSSTNLFDLP